MKFRAFAWALALPGLSAGAAGVTAGGGWNASSAAGAKSDGLTRQVRYGYNAGFGYEAEITPSLFIVPEINLETRGEIRRFRAEDFPPLNARLNLLYLQFPLFLMFKIPVGPAVVDFFAGPEIGIPLSGEWKLNGITSATYDVEDELNPVDIGLEAGGGVGIPLGAATFFVRPGYYTAFTKTFKESSGEDGETRLRNVKIKAGIRIPL